jgi:hypothetical protein
VGGVRQASVIGRPRLDGAGGGAHQHRASTHCFTLRIPHPATSDAPMSHRLLLIAGLLVAAASRRTS